MDYQGRLQDEFIRAMFKVATEAGAESGQPFQPDGKATAMFDSAAIVSVCVSTIAFAVHGSSEVSSPTKMRAFCDQLARKLQRHITVARADPNFAALVTQTIEVGNLQ